MNNSGKFKEISCMHERRRCLTFLLLGFIWLYVFMMSRTLFRVNLHSIVARMSRNSLLEISAVPNLFTNKWFWVGIPLQLLGFIFDHIFGPKNDNLFCAVFVFHRGMSNGICDLILYLKNEGLNISWISLYSSILILKNGIHNTVLYSVSSWAKLYFSKVRWINTRSRRWIYTKTSIFVLSFLKFNF